MLSNHQRNRFAPRSTFQNTELLPENDRKVYTVKSEIRNFTMPMITFPRIYFDNLPVFRNKIQSYLLAPH